MGGLEIEKPYSSSRRSAENIAAVNDIVAEGLELSILRRLHSLDLFHGTFWSILHLHPLTQEVKPRDHGQRRIYVEWLVE